MGGVVRFRVPDQWRSGTPACDGNRQPWAPVLLSSATLAGGLDWDRDIEPRLHCRRDKRKRRVA